jgi:hypothetical protein
MLYGNTNQICSKVLLFSGRICGGFGIREEEEQ